MPFLTILLCAIAATSHAATRPNIILIVVDDMGRDWVSCYGAENQTPNIDRLATQGVRYETAWCMPVGTPTRVTMLTGQYPFRHRWTRHGDAPRRDGGGLSSTRFTTFARVLQDNGYATAIGGKWQINDLSVQPDALRKHGFDEHCVWTGADPVSPERSNPARDAPKRSAPKHGVPKLGAPKHDVPKLGAPESETQVGRGHILTNGHAENVSDGSDSINRFLIDFIQRHKSTQPFLVYYPMLLARSPQTTTPLLEGNPSDVKETLFATNVRRADQLVGRLIATVDQLGISKNTLVVFTSDNGSAVAGTLGGIPFEKGKGRKADLGAHVPFIVRAPFLSPGHRISRDLIDATDLFPTFLDLANATCPPGVALDGRSFEPSLRGTEDPFEKRNWIFSQLGDFRMVRDWQHIVDSDGNFHDLTKDPLQQHEVSTLDKIAPGRRQRLEMILERFPKNAAEPFAD
ncbi:MAG: sulfatase-like hydrolase/transferase [Rubripirellula sp.]